MIYQSSKIMPNLFFCVKIQLLTNPVNQVNLAPNLTKSDYVG